MTDILVKRLSLLQTSTRSEVGRYFEVESMSTDSTLLRPGLTARFFALGKKGFTEGTIVEMSGGTLAVDTFTGDK